MDHIGQFITPGIFFCSVVMRIIKNINAYLSFLIAINNTSTYK